MNTTRATLLIRLKDLNDRAAWAEFDSIYRPILYRFALARGLAHADAEDVVQECMATIQTHMAGFDYDPKKGRFKAWLKTMVNNRVRNFFRDRRETQADSAAFARPQEREPTPDEQFEKFWLAAHLRYCLARLEQETDGPTFAVYRSLVLEDKPVEEACKEEGMTPNQVYKLRWRLTERMRELMRDLVGDTESDP